MTMMITINTINLIMITLIMIISGLDASHVAHYIAEQEVIALQG